jgi:hypothetical protein
MSATCSFASAAAKTPGSRVSTAFEMSFMAHLCPTAVRPGEPIRWDQATPGANGSGNRLWLSLDIRFRSNESLRLIALFDDRRWDRRQSLSTLRDGMRHCRAPEGHPGV